MQRIEGWVCFWFSRLRRGGVSDGGGGAMQQVSVLVKVEGAMHCAVSRIPRRPSDNHPQLTFFVKWEDN